MKTLLIVHYREEIEKFKFILPKLGDVTAVFDTNIGITNKDKWTYRGDLLLQEVGVPKRPWWYELARDADDYGFFKSLPQSEYYKKRVNLNKLSFLPLGFLKNFYQTPKYIKDHLKKLSPDIVITTSLAFPPLHVQAEYILESKRLGIPTVSLIPNWDALTTKGKMWPIPDYVFCWNDYHEIEMKYHGKTNIKKVGAFSFEDWLRPHTPTRKDKFYKRWELKDPIYTYLTSSNSIAGWETDSVEQWRDWMRKEEPEATLVVRPHPDKIHIMNQVEGVKCIPKISQGVFEDDAFQLAYDTYHYSKTCYGINTSAFIEAMLVGTTCYALNVKFTEKDAQGGQDGIHFQQLKPLLDKNGPEKIRDWLGIGKVMPSELIVKAILAILKK